ncbi:hypothetical protein GCM10009759_67450 [Kitasatospora saccharophila]|uniref:DUF317 domain-containing protein n=1 Tax=Kitasatospora saccharophila TaxID=407973 RepID=A0ABP5JKS1_9ACTN
MAVGPRHFIGPPPGADDLLADFLTDRGWQRPREDRLIRPCGRLGVHLPRGSFSEWTVWGAQHRGAQVAWSITVGTAIPTELLAATVTEAETILEETQPDAREPYARGLVALGLIPLARADWRDDVDPRGSVSFRPPDGYANAAASAPSYLHELRGKPAATVSSYGPNSYWDAKISAGTPSRVLAALARELASDEPLLRPADYVRSLTYSRRHITVRPLTEQSEENLSPAAQAARSRSSTSAPAPAPISSTPPPAPTAVAPAHTAGR